MAGRWAIKQVPNRDHAAGPGAAAPLRPRTARETSASRIGEGGSAFRRSYSHSGAEGVSFADPRGAGYRRANGELVLAHAAVACSGRYKMVEYSVMAEAKKEPVVFDHEKLDVYRVALEVIGQVERLLKTMKAVVAAKNHLWRASESMVRNIVRANTRRTPADQVQAFDVAYGSGLECAACMDVLRVWGLLDSADVYEAKVLLDRIVAMLVGLRSMENRQVRESSAEYVAGTQSESIVFFTHEALRVYQSALRFVGWCATLIQSESVGFSRGRELDRHATSIALNIAEGNGKFSVPDRRRFLDIALGAGLQAAASLDLLMAREWISENTARQGKKHLAEIVSMIGAMSRSLS